MAIATFPRGGLHARRDFFSAAAVEFEGRGTGSFRPLPGPRDPATARVAGALSQRTRIHIRRSAREQKGRYAGGRAAHAFGADRTRHGGGGGSCCGAGYGQPGRLRQRRAAVATPVAPPQVRPITAVATVGQPGNMPCAHQTCRKDRRTHPGTDLVVLLLFPGFSNLCLATRSSPLRAANTLARRPHYRWRFRGHGGRPPAVLERASRTARAVRRGRDG